ncbi:MAG: cation transporter [Acidimicrobiaceae bacterium]|nr:cation transporter [Acidimicrobiaceae bacterium]
MSRSNSHHEHGVSGSSDARLLKIALILLLVYMAIEVVLAFFAHSLALLADAGHMLTDAGALGASLWASSLSTRPARGKWTYGFVRAEILSAAGNGVTLLVVAAIISVEAISHLVHPGDVGGGLVVATASLGVVVNVTAAWILAKANRSSLNVEGAFQHIVTDLYAFVATIVAGIVIVASGFQRADAIASLIVVALMLKASWGLLRASGRILLEAAPDNVDLDVVRTHLLGVGHVRDVHDLHAWTVTSNLPILSAHVVIDDACFSEGCIPRILDQLQACLTGHFDVEHSTFQVEPARHLDHESGTH